ncbi:multiple sugar-binding protein [Lachnospiraceae bacterium]|nr:multiple sugar-binding protein [Lachnospiraceae bacterium]
MRKKGFAILSCAVLAAGVLAGCGNQDNGGKTEIELVQYKPEAVEVFKKLEEKFNSTHDDIHLKIDSPNDTMTILKTRFVREDYPDILGIGGDINYSYFIDSDILADVSDFDGLSEVNQGYVDILEGLEFVPTEGTYGVPYVANAAGILYNREMFKEHGWKIPTTWEELMTLCDTIQSEGILPFYFGFKDVWTCLAPWNSLAVDLAPADVCQQVNAGKTEFSKEYKETAEKMLQLVQYGEEGPFAYGYNDACTAFANGESAMFAIGSYAVPQIKSVNPDMDIDSFVTPGSDSADGNTLNSGVDLMFAVTEDCENKEAAYEVIRFLMEDENIQAYLDDQNAVPCKNGEFNLAPNLDGMKEYIASGNMTDYQDHYYPSEMAVDAQIQTFLIEQDVDAFLNKFDKDWLRYNRDIIRKVEEYNAENK